MPTTDDFQMSRDYISPTATLDADWQGASVSTVQVWSGVVHHSPVYLQYLDSTLSDLIPAPPQPMYLEEPAYPAQPDYTAQHVYQPESPYTPASAYTLDQIDCPLGVNSVNASLSLPWLPPLPDLPPPTPSAGYLALDDIVPLESHYSSLASQIFDAQFYGQEVGVSTEVVRPGDGSLAQSPLSAEQESRVGIQDLVPRNTEGFGVSSAAADVGAAEELQWAADETLTTKEKKFENTRDEESAPVTADELEAFLRSFAEPSGSSTDPQQMSSEPAQSSDNEAGPSKKHQCPECESKFNRQLDCERHFKSRHLQLIHSCPHCDKSYTRPDAVVRHVQTKHLDELPPKEQAAITARAARKRVREGSENEEGPRDGRGEEEARPAKKARVTTPSGSEGKRTRAKAGPKMMTVGGKV